MKSLPIALLALILPLWACTTVAYPGATLEEEQQPRENRQSIRGTEYAECQSFEVLDFGTFEAQGLSGNAWSGSEPPQPLSDVRLVARATETGEVQSAVTSEDGSFAFRGLSNGEYAVSACLEGFDELQFKVRVHPETSVAHFDLFFGASEALGRRDVVAVEAPINR